MHILHFHIKYKIFSTSLDETKAIFNKNECILCISLSRITTSSRGIAGAGWCIKHGAGWCSASTCPMLYAPACPMLYAPTCPSYIPRDISQCRQLYNTQCFPLKEIVTLKMKNSSIIMHKWNIVSQKQMCAKRKSVIYMLVKRIFFVKIALMV